MEVVGGIAAVAGIAAPAAAVAKVAAKLCLELREAPSQLAEIRNRVQIFKNVLSELGKPANDPLIPDDERKDLLEVIHCVQESLAALQIECRKVSKTEGIRSSIKWTLLSKHTIKSLEDQLHSRQTLLLTCITTKQYLAQLSSTNSIKQLIDEKLPDHPRPPNPSPPPQPQPTEICLSSLTRVGKQRQESSYALFRPLPSWLTYLGFTGRVIQIIRESDKVCYVLAKIRVPFANGKHNIAYLAEFVVRFGSVLPKMAMSTYNIVPEDAPIMTACAQGNLPRVQQLFRAREASVDDLTPSYNNPLFHAINSGNTALVKFLLNNGSNVNQPFGRNETSPLQWALYKRRMDITRVFARRGAIGDYVSALSWTPLFYLLVDHTEKSLLDKTSSTIDFLRILASEDVLLDLEVRDNDNMTVLDHAVRYGTGAEVTALLQLKAQLGPDGIDPWTVVGSPMSQAIVTGNFSAFLALFPEYKRYINSTYGDGWSMLHLAAYMGHDDMVRHLLKNGAEEFFIDMDEELEAARLYQSQQDGEEENRPSMTYDTYTKYMKALHDDRRIEVRYDDTENEMEEIFWDANDE